MGTMLAALLLAASTAGCAADAPGPAAGADAEPGASTSRPAPGTTTPEVTPSAPEAGEEATTAPPRRGPRTADGRPRQARLSIPAIGLRDIAVVPYRGRPDDAPGTEIQDGGVAASPHGPRGGAGPGGVGNYLVTAHRTSSTRAFFSLPDLRRGDRVRVEAGGVRYVYRVVATRETSFRSEASRRRQEAAVPGRPGVEPTRAMITLSTCATPEDRAAGNYWSDEFGNPEHRIDKIGVLVRSVPLAG